MTIRHLMIYPLLAAGWISGATAADYPVKPIRLIVPYTAGGPTDATARVAARGIEEKTGKAVVVENRPGGGTLIGFEAAAQAAPDGHTLVLASPNLSQFPVVLKDYKANLTARLAAVAVLATSPYVIMVRSDVPAKNIRELADHVRANPGKLNYGLATTGGPQLVHLFLNKRYELRMSEIYYQGTSQVQPAIIRGDIHMYTGLPGTWLPLINQGQLRAIAVVDDRRNALLPSVPTLVEQGLPEFEGIVGTWFGIMAPSGTPAPIIESLNRWINEYAASPAGTDQLKKLGLDPASVSPQEFAARLANEERRWAAIARESGFRPQ